MSDYYEVLGVPRTASQDDIKASYRKLAREYHPDVAKNKRDAEAHFKEINEAFSVIGDPEKRAQYDRFGRVTGAPDAGMPFGDVGDLFEMFFGGGVFGGAAGRRRGPRVEHGEDLRTDVSITLEQAATGVTTEVKVEGLRACETCRGSGAAEGAKIVTCAQCGGAGQVQQLQTSMFSQMIRTFPCVACGGQGQVPEKPCVACQGAGRIHRNRTMEVHIPAGLEDGTALRLEGEGEAGRRGGRAGSLYVVVRVKPHPVFERGGADLACERTVTFTDAALGADVEVATLDGKATLKVAAGTQSGTVLRLKGKGLPHLRSSRHGDLQVRIVVMVPTRLNDKQKKMLKEFAAAGSQEADKGFFEKVRDAILG